MDAKKIRPGLMIGILIFFCIIIPPFRVILAFFVISALIRIIYLKNTINKGQRVSVKIISLKKLNNLDKKTVGSFYQSPFFVAMPLFGGLVGLYVVLLAIDITDFYRYVIMASGVIFMIFLFKYLMKHFKEPTNINNNDVFYRVILKYNTKLYHMDTVSGSYLRGYKVDDKITMLNSHKKLFFLKKNKPTLIYATLKN